MMVFTELSVVASFYPLDPLGTQLAKDVPRQPVMVSLAGTRDRLMRAGP